MSVDEHLELLKHGTKDEQLIALRRIGFRLTVCNRNRFRAREAQREADEIVLKTFDAVEKLLVRNVENRHIGTYQGFLMPSAAVVHSAENTLLRVAAVQVMGEFLNEPAILLLSSATSDEDSNVAKQAWVSLFRLEGEMPHREIHSAIRAAYQRQTPNSESARLLERCLGQLSPLKWVLWRIAKRNSEKCTMLFEDGNRFANKGSYQVAVDYYRDAIQYWPYDRVLWLSLGECLIKSDNQQEGVDVLIFGAALCPFEPQTLNRLADGLKETGMLEEANYWYTQTLELVPGTPAQIVAYRGRGDVMAKLHRKAEAIVDYQKALSLLRQDSIFATSSRDIAEQTSLILGMIRKLEDR